MTRIICFELSKIAYDLNFLKPLYMPIEVVYNTEVKISREDNLISGARL